MASDGRVDRSVVIVFDVLAFIFLVLLLVVLLTAAVSHQVQRKGSWFNFMLPVTLYPASFLLLLGEQSHTQPPFPLCILQAVLVYALPAYFATGFACYVFDFYFLLKGIFHGIRPSNSVLRSILIIPPVVFLAVIVLDLTLFLADNQMRASLEPDASGIYCHSGYHTQMLITAAIGLPSICLWFYAYIKTALLLRKQRLAIAAHDILLRRRILSVFIRTTLVIAVTCIAVVFSVKIAIASFESKPHSIFQYLVAPFVALILFGTQSDMLNFWMCRRTTKPPATSDRATTASPSCR